MDVDGKRLIFVGGLHRSGTTPLARAMAAHPAIGGLSNTDVEEDEGQHLQKVYPVAMTHGGPGRFALKPAAHLTEQSPLVSPENARRLWDSWSPYWDMDRPLLLEKSPPNLVMGRFLQALFPGSAFVVVIRHPVIVTLGTKKWAPRTSLSRLMEHWFTAHRTLRQDLSRLDRVTMLRYEDLVADPAGELGRIGSALQLDDPIPSDLIQTSRSEGYQQRWDEMATGSLLARRSRATIETRFTDEAAQYGYNLSDITDLGRFAGVQELAD
jgi:Sulfotransferase family